MCGLCFPDKLCLGLRELEFYSRNLWPNLFGHRSADLKHHYTFDLISHPYLLFPDEEEVWVIFDNVPVLPRVGEEQLHLVGGHIARIAAAALKSKDTYVKKSRVIGCVIPRCTLKRGITQPIPRLF